MVGSAKLEKTYCMQAWAHTYPVRLIPGRGDRVVPREFLDMIPPDVVDDVRRDLDGMTVFGEKILRVVMSIPKGRDVLLYIGMDGPSDVGKMVNIGDDRVISFYMHEREGLWVAAKEEATEIGLIIEVYR